MGKLDDIPDRKVTLWMNLLGLWPTITNGGPRFIIQAGFHFLHHINMISDQGITCDGKRSIKVPNEDKTAYILHIWDKQGKVR